MKNALRVYRKEIKEVRKNKSIWAPVLIISFMFSLFIPIILIFIGDIGRDAEILDFINKIFGSNVDPQKAMIRFMVKQFIIFLLLIPAMVPSLIAPASVIFEKESRTLEPLLATPIKTKELMLGKTFTSFIPSFIISIINFIVLGISINTVAYIKFDLLPLPNLEWFVSAFVLSPVISFIITTISLVFSSKTTDIRSAQGIGSAIIIPIYAIIGLQIAGLFLLNVYYMLLGCAVLIAICPFLLKLAIKTFDRENILTKWKMK
ncbi:MAG: ABC transporter permease [Actinomycetota bacterium]